MGASFLRACACAQASRGTPCCNLETPPHAQRRCSRMRVPYHNSRSSAHALCHCGDPPPTASLFTALAILGLLCKTSRKFPGCVRGMNDGLRALRRVEAYVCSASKKKVHGMFAGKSLRECLFLASISSANSAHSALVGASDEQSFPIVCLSVVPSRFDLNGGSIRVW